MTEFGISLVTGVNENVTKNAQNIVTTAELETEVIRPPYSSAYWYICEAVLSLLTIFALYLAACVIRYGVKHNWKSGRESNSKGRWLYAMCVMAIFSTILRLVADHVAAFIGWRSTEACIGTITASSVMYAFSLFPSYLFLWLKQSIFYANPVLKKILNKWVTFISWMTLVVIIICGTLVVVLYNIPQVTGWRYKAGENGCVEVEGNTDVISFVAIGITIFFQVSLLSLFLYPLISRKTQRYRSAGKKMSSEPTSDADTNISATQAHSSSDFSKETSEKSSSYSRNQNFNAIPKVPLDESTDIERDSVRINTVTNPPMPNGQTNKGSQSPNKLCRLIKDSNFARTFSNSTVFHHRTQNQHPQIIDKKFTPLNTTTSVPSDAAKNSSVYTKKKSKRFSRSKKRKQGRQVIQYIRKSFIIMLICVVTDIIVNVIQEFEIWPELSYLVLFDVNLIVNDICILASYREWKAILLPFIRDKSPQSLK